MEMLENITMLLFFIEICMFYVTPENLRQKTPLNTIQTYPKNTPKYAQTLIRVKSIVVKIIGFLVITRNPVGISGPY